MTTHKNNESDDSRQSVGWTKAEFDAAPEAIGRLHARILDLEDERHWRPIISRRGVQS